MLGLPRLSPHTGQHAWGDAVSTDKAACPVLRDVIARALMDATDDILMGDWQMFHGDIAADLVLSALGIDPDMSIDELRELLAPEPDFDALTIPPPKVNRRGRIVWDDPATPDNTDGLSP